MAIEPDTKNWTWVVDRACEECGFDATAFPVEEIPRLIHDNTRAWSAALATEDVAVRPAPEIWSPLEYACHVRDVHRLFDERVTRMLVEDDPLLPDWDQDAAAVQGDYISQDPVDVELGLIESAAAVAGRYATLSDDQWQRPGRRTHGPVTVESQARVHLHELVHHLYDVGS